MNRAQALRLACPKCGAPPHMPCMGKRGPRTAHHAERYSELRNIGYRISKGVRERRCNTPGYVYVVSAKGTGSVKIGFSADAPEKRMRNLQTANSHELVLLCFIQGTRRDEERLHDQFAHLRIRGEWFRDEPELRDYFAEMCV
jgi:hypothetical protein